MDAFELSRPSQSEAIPFRLRPGVGQTAQLLDLIATAEAGRMGYDAVNMGARTQPPALPTRLTVAEVFAWIEATPGQPHAIGRYQFIPSTLARLVEIEGVPLDAWFAPGLQDRLAGRLLAEAGYADFLAGDLSRPRFMDRMAKIWAGLPLQTGKSAYHGYAGNRATISLAAFTRGMEAIFGG